MRRSRRTAMAMSSIAAMFFIASGVVPFGARQAKPASGGYDLTTVALAGSSASALPPAGGAPGTRGALALAAKAPSVATTAWSARIELRDHPLMVAFSWTGKTSAQLQVRTSDGTTFGDWVEVDGEATHGPDKDDPNQGKNITSTDPVWVGSDTSEIEVKVEQGRLPGLTMTKFNWHGTMPTSGSAGFGAGIASAELAQPAIHGRATWDQGHGYRTDIDGCQDGPDYAPALKMAVIHHTVNANNYSQAQVPQLIYGIYQWHTAHNGWCDIGYNFLVDRFGGVWQGRSGDAAMPVWGAHAVGFNYETMGVAMIGAYQPGASPAAGTPSAAMLAGVERLIAWKFAINAINPLGKTTYEAGAGSHWPEGTKVTINTIVGHRDTSSTECPGDNAERLLPTIRQAVANDIAAAALPASRWSPFTTSHSLIRQQFNDVLYRAGNSAEWAWWINVMVSTRWTGARTTAALITSHENQSTTLPVLRLYFSAFRRWADIGGLRAWSFAIKYGTPLDQVADRFATSNEFKDLYGANTTNEQYVTLLYRNVLDRAPDAGGMQAWLGALNAGRSRGSVMVGFSESNEHKTALAPFTNVAQVYFPLLGRAPDAPSFSWALAVFDRSGVAGLTSALWGSNEYRNRVT